MNRQKPIRHGTPGGYQAHRRRGVPVTDECGCRDARNARDTCRRRENGTQARIAGPYTSVPTTVLADLYLNASQDAQERAEANTSDGVLTLAVARYDQENQ